MNRLVAVLLAVALGAGAVFGEGHTLWQDGGVQLCGSSAEGDPLATSDGAGGEIVMWEDSRQWPHGIYAQRVDASGVPLWAEDGILVCDSTGQGPFGVIDDGEHGAVTGWNLYNLPFAVQRVSAEGAPLWGSNGLVLRPPGDNLGECAALVRDGHGGAIVVWIASSLYFELDTLIACRVDSSGTKLWETVVRVDTLGVDPPCLCEDGSGGVIIAWYEYNGYSGHWAGRVQRVDSAGGIKWDAAGVPVCTLTSVQYTQGCVAVAESCYVVGWLGGGGDTWQNRAQMFDPIGNRRWGPTGASISGLLSRSAGVGLPAGDARQSLWVWTENRTGVDNLFAQKLDSNGARCWDSTGVWLGTSDTTYMYKGFSVTADGRGGAIATWALYRSRLNWDIYGQRVDSVGRPCWSDTGLAVCPGDNNVRYPVAVSDGDGGSIIAWKDDRGIYAQRVAGEAGVMETPIAEGRKTNTGPTIVREVLFLPANGEGRVAKGELLNVSGRKVLDLHPGANDVRALAPGVYFVREEPQAASLKPQAVLKVILTR
jgi:hypothetical protein